MPPMVNTRAKRQTKIKPVRNPANTTFSISCSIEDRARMDARAADLGVDRSTYIMCLVRRDCL